MSSSDAGPTDTDRQTTAEMERVTYREPMCDELETLVDAGVFPNRSEAIRAATRQLVSEYNVEESDE